MQYDGNNTDLSHFRQLQWGTTAPSTCFPNRFLYGPALLRKSFVKDGWCVRWRSFGTVQRLSGHLRLFMNRSLTSSPGQLGLDKDEGLVRLMLETWTSVPCPTQQAPLRHTEQVECRASPHSNPALGIFTRNQWFSRLRTYFAPTFSRLRTYFTPTFSRLRTVFILVFSRLRQSLRSGQRSPPAAPATRRGGTRHSPGYTKAASRTLFNCGLRYGILQSCVS